MKKRYNIKEVVVALVTLLVAAALAAVIISACTNAAFAAEFETWYVGADNLNFRAAPEGEIITVLPHGTELQIIGTDGGDWWQAYDGGYLTGWVHKDYMVDTPDKFTCDDIFTYHGYRDMDYIGSFKVTQYNTSLEENGGYTKTACGDKLTEVVGLAVAVDPNVIPLGTKLYISGIGYRTARDTGGAIKGNKIDLLVWQVDSSWGNGQYDVYIAY